MVNIQSNGTGSYLNEDSEDPGPEGVVFQKPINHPFSWNAYTQLSHNFLRFWNLKSKRSRFFEITTSWNVRREKLSKSSSSLCQSGVLFSSPWWYFWNSRCMSSILLSNDARAFIMSDLSSETVLIILIPFPRCVGVFHCKDISHSLRFFPAWTIKWNRTEFYRVGSRLTFLGHFTLFLL